MKTSNPPGVAQSGRLVKSANALKTLRTLPKPPKLKPMASMQINKPPKPMMGQVSDPNHLRNTLSSNSITSRAAGSLTGGGMLKAASAPGKPENATYNEGREHVPGKIDSVLGKLVGHRIGYTYFAPKGEGPDGYQYQDDYNDSTKDKEPFMRQAARPAWEEFNKDASSKAPWDKKNPKEAKGKSKTLTPEQKSKAKARAAAAGRPYPNWIDNAHVAKTAMLRGFEDELQKVASGWLADDPYVPRGKEKAEARKSKKMQKCAAETPAWTLSEGKEPKGGLNRAGVASYRRPTRVASLRWR